MAASASRPSTSAAPTGCQTGRPCSGSTSSGIPNNFEITAPGVSKGEGLCLLCRTLGIDIAQTVACGDEGNDVSILRSAGLGVAMGNATAEAKAAADVQVADCDHDGVAEAIERYLGQPIRREGRE